MKIGDVYYEKHTVVSISKRTGTVSETDTEIVKVIPLEVLDKIRAEVEQDAFKDVNGSKYIFVNRVNQIIDKYESEETK